MQNWTVPSHLWGLDPDFDRDLDLLRRAQAVPPTRPEPARDPLAFATQAMLLGRILEMSLTDARARREAQEPGIWDNRLRPQAG
ncbi:hypothetical protein [Streptomyces griseorubiginosus]|uniref:hypothetical protein n=1 Tax=Streptomyces griseorubiginosus TaxID=67304 RepID=UPI00114083C9|nr:hypothetical protein [Streptomyces griseorubiginosus]